MCIRDSVFPYKVINVRIQSIDDKLHPHQTADWLLSFEIFLSYFVSLYKVRIVVITLGTLTVAVIGIITFCQVDQTRFQNLYKQHDVSSYTPYAFWQF